MKTEVHYDMPFEEYLAYPALSSSAIKIIDISISDFIHGIEKESKALTLGTAIHDAVLFGLKIFHQKYTTPYVKEDDVLDTVKDLKGFCKENSISVKSTWLKEDIINHILDEGFEPRLYDKEKAAHEGGKIVLSEEDFERALTIESHISNSSVGVEIKEMKKEVSVFWTDKNGIRCKCRFDGLDGDIFDLKSFDNSMKKPVEQAVIADIFKWKYHISAVMYYEGYQAAREAGFEDFTKKDPVFHLLFCQTRGGYNYRLMTLRKNPSDYVVGGNGFNEYWLMAEQKIKKAKELYKRHVMEKMPVNHFFNPQEIFDADIPNFYLRD